MCCLSSLNIYHVVDDNGQMKVKKRGKRINPPFNSYGQNIRPKLIKDTRVLVAFNTCTLQNKYMEEQKQDI